MSDTARPLTTPTLLSAAASLASALLFVALVFVGSLPPALSAVIRSTLPILAPTLLAVAAMTWWSRSHDGRRSGWPLVVALVAASAAASVLFVASFGAGMDDGDAGRPIGFFGGLTWWFALVGVGLAGAAAGLLTRVLLPRRRWLVPIAVGAVTAIPAFSALVHPIGVVVSSLIMLTALLIESTESVSRLQSVDGDAPRLVSAVPPRALGVIALATIAVVWGAAALVGTTQSGQPGATMAMGCGSALGPLAAIPLLFALAATPSHRSFRRYLVVPVVGIGLGAVVQMVWWSPMGTATFVGSAVAGVTVGWWFAISILPRLTASGTTKTVVGSAIVVGGVLVWFMLVTMTASFMLVAPAIVAIALGSRGPASAREVAPA